MPTVRVGGGWRGAGRRCVPEELCRLVDDLSCSEPAQHLRQAGAELLLAASGVLSAAAAALQRVGEPSGRDAGDDAE